MTDKANITPEMLRAALSYEPETGRLIFKSRPHSDFVSDGVAKRWNTLNAGRETFLNVTEKGYRSGRVYGRQLLAHRVAWAIYYGKWPSLQVDHINGDPADNRIANLRDVPQSINQRNVKLRRDNTSGFVGVWRNRDRWEAWVPSGDGRHKRLGRFQSKEQAVAARAQAVEDMGFTARHGAAQ